VYEYLNIDTYESIGTPMFSKVISNFIIENKEYNWNKNFINIDIFAPYKWYQMELLFSNNNNNNINISDSCCLHWFNGSEYSKKFTHVFNHYSFNNINISNFSKIFNSYLNVEDKLFLKKFKKVSIVMAYYNRKEQLIDTLKSIKKSSYKNIEIIIVDDASEQRQRVNTFINDVKGTLDIKVITIDSKEKTWVNPCVAYNIGFKEAIGDIIIIQNPEVMHIGDCILNVVNNIEENDWITFNCYGSPSFDYNYIIQNKTSDEIYKIILNSSYGIGGNSVQRDDVGGWLNHHDKHFVAYHYLSAIHRNDLINKMNGGFNEVFKNGIGADDDEFIKRLIYNKFNFKINEFKEHEPFAIHQFHEKPNALKTIDFNINKNIFKDCCIKMNLTPENNIVLVPENERPMARRLII
jgi:glycosyltransferase involved in cell wall biosynthesis